MTLPTPTRPAPSRHRTRPGTAARAHVPAGAGRLLAWLFGAGLVLMVGLSVVHLTQGTASVGLDDLLAWLRGDASATTGGIVVASRLPRLGAALAVGAALGASGAALQAVASNPLASPDTLAVNAGAYLALALVSAFGLSTGVIGGSVVALVGGLAAAGLAFVLTGGGGSTVRLILGGSVLTLALSSLTSALLIVFSQQTQGLFAWGAGSLSQSDPGSVVRAAALIAVGVVAMVALGGRLDLLQLGDDQARTLGVNVVANRLVVVLVAVFLAAVSVALAGPIGFVGLCAPALVRLAATRVPGLHRHRPLVLAAALTGALLVLGSDVVLRAAIGAAEAAAIPTGVLTTLLGAVFLVILSQGMRTGRADANATLAGGARLARWAGWLTGGLAALLVVGATLALLAGDGWLLLGDIGYWLQGRASPRITFMLDARWPRVAAAVLAGAALALAGTLTQAVTRNALAEPGLLGVSAGAGVGALAVIIGGSRVGVGIPTWAVTAVALAGALAAGALLFALAARGGFNPTRLVLVGLGVAAGGQALGTLLVVSTDPWNQSRAITWLGGSTYGTMAASLPPVAALVVLLGVAALALRRDLDLVQLDDDTPRLLGVRQARVRASALLAAVLLTGAATAAVGVIGFVGLIAPHLARLLVGPQHRRMTGLAVVLGALLVLAADTLGRSVLAPAQLPVGLVCALVGAPVFWWLMYAQRGDR
ncbi:iron ABC transporter permease [Propioniciclava soli]|uniref:Iron ABC transporter permease n=1 Tax=Propioniciclava soli TaxID=2775081 RepID=A0ABZ3C5B8_9ACTN|nr:iron ABC transporter permease [Propioniciclava soli]